ncbi:vWA domain-containing protein [Alkalibacillus silvisoli]|uniref:VWFA domain-containing protein n=1 Tax=Alkalibacillus silvisoli TaxID=392823 RepID=A0ABP3JXU6_9BACI
MKIRLIAITVICLYLLSGCFQSSNSGEELESIEIEAEAEEEEDNKEENDDEKESNEQESEEEEIEVDPIPSTFEELVAQEVGENAKQYNELGKSWEERRQEIYEDFSDLPELSEDPSEEELDYFYRELLRKAQFDFKGPEEVLSQFKFHSFGNPDIGDTRYEFKENLNVIILLDASGSMAAEVSGKVKMDAAKDAITNFMKNLPEETNVALRVYGHEGSSSSSDQQLSCESTELVYGFDQYNESDFKQSLGSVQPAGWTPIGLALKEAQEDLSSFDGETNTNIVYLVSDGIETCDTNPVEAADELYHSNITPIINVIGFDVDGEGQNHLKEIADTVEGIFETANDESELADELNKVSEIARAWDDWKRYEGYEVSSVRSSNYFEIFSYTTQNRVSRTTQRHLINSVLSVYSERDLIDRESFSYLREKNREFHTWLTDEIERINDELHELNEASYEEAVEQLEEIFESNVD